MLEVHFFLICALQRPPRKRSNASPELTHNNCYDQEHQYCDNRHRDNLVRRHPIKKQVSNSYAFSRDRSPQARHPPPRHALQSLVTPIRITLTLQQRPTRMLNRLPLPAQVRKGIAANILRLERNPLTLPQPP